MQIEELQTAVGDLLRSGADFTGITVVEDDGTYPQIPARERALRDVGLCITVWPVGCVGVIDRAPEGSFLYLAAVHCVVEENVSKNRATPGRPNCLKLARLVIDRLKGQLGDNSPDSGLQPMPEVFGQLGRLNGVSRVVVNFARQFA